MLPDLEELIAVATGPGGCHDLDVTVEQRFTSTTAEPALAPRRWSGRLRLEDHAWRDLDPFPLLHDSPLIGHALRAAPDTSAVSVDFHQRLLFLRLLPTYSVHDGVEADGAPFAELTAWDVRLRWTRRSGGGRLAAAWGGPDDRAEVTAELGPDGLPVAQTTVRSWEGGSSTASWTFGGATPCDPERVAGLPPAPPWPHPTTPSAEAVLDVVRGPPGCLATVSLERGDQYRSPVRYEAGWEPVSAFEFLPLVGAAAWVDGTVGEVRTAPDGVAFPVTAPNGAVVEVVGRWAGRVLAGVSATAAGEEHAVELGADGHLIRETFRAPRMPGGSERSFGAWTACRAVPEGIRDDSRRVVWEPRPPGHVDPVGAVIADAADLLWGPDGCHEYDVVLREQRRGAARPSVSWRGRLRLEDHVWSDVDLVPEGFGGVPPIGVWPPAPSDRCFDGLETLDRPWAWVAAGGGIELHDPPRIDSVWVDHGPADTRLAWFGTGPDATASLDGHPLRTTQPVRCSTPAGTLRATFSAPLPCEHAPAALLAPPTPRPVPSVAAVLAALRGPDGCVTTTMGSPIETVGTHLRLDEGRWRATVGAYSGATWIPLPVGPSPLWAEEHVVDAVVDGATVRFALADGDQRLAVGADWSDDGAVRVVLDWQGADGVEHDVLAFAPDGWLTTADQTRERTWSDGIRRREHVVRDFAPLGVCRPDVAPPNSFRPLLPAWSAPWR